MEIDPKKNTKQENYKFLIGSVLPRPIAFVTTVNEEGLVNAAPFSFFSIVCVDPPMLSITCSKKPGGISKDTARNIKLNKEFVVHIVTKENVAMVNETAIEFPPNISEVEILGIELTSSYKVKPPRIKCSPIHMECILHNFIELGNDTGCDLVIGEIVHMHIEDSLYNNGRIDTKLLDPIGRLAGTDYVKLGEVFSMSRSKYEDWANKK